MEDFKPVYYYFLQVKMLKTVVRRRVVSKSRKCSAYHLTMQLTNVGFSDRLIASWGCRCLCDPLGLSSHTAVNSNVNGRCIPDSLKKLTVPHDSFQMYHTRYSADLSTLTLLVWDSSFLGKPHALTPDLPIPTLFETWAFLSLHFPRHSARYSGGTSLEARTQTHDRRLTPSKESQKEGWVTSGHGINICIKQQSVEV